jgi:alkaline phosphatase
MKNSIHLPRSRGSLRIATSTCLALLLLAVGMPPADAQQPSKSQVPRSADEWFAAGRATVIERRGKSKPSRAKNVILFVGDGMGISTVTAARILDGQNQGIDGEYHRLSFERFDHLALSVTASANQQTSDSAPTGTALVTGIKANDGAISVDQSISPSETSAEVTTAKSAKSILERAEERGLSTGVVTTARFTHATPAVNYAHVADRDWEVDSALPAGASVRDIALQLLEFPYGDGLEVALGGGRTNFLPSTSQDPEYPSQVGRRKDNRDLTAEWTQKYSKAAYVWNQSQFAAIDPASTNHLLGLFQPSHMRFERDRENDASGEPSLAAMTEKAIQILKKNKRGYYLMVEAGRIDHAHHAGNAFRALTDTIALSQAVAKARQLTSDTDTLIIVTADHSHTFTIGGYPDRGNPILGKVTTGGKLQRDLLGLPFTTLSYANGQGWAGNFTRREFDNAGESAGAAPYKGRNLRPDLTDVDTASPGYLQEATVPLRSETHGGEEVAIYAQGPGAELFRGVLEQNVVYHVMADALGFAK